MARSLASKAPPLRVGWIGTGIMGLPMCGHLLAAGHQVTVFTRTRSRADPLLAQGARWAASPAALARDADVVITMLGYPDDVREVTLGAGAVMASMRPGSLLVDMTTSEPSLAVMLHQAAAKRGIDALDAPVSGGDVGARNASLVVMAGGAPAAFARALPLFERLARRVVHEGGPGAGQHTKMVNQIAIASGMIGVCEALLYAARSGLDVERVLDTIAEGAAGSWSLSNYGPRLITGDMEPGFKIDHFLKDLGIALSEARRMGLELPGLTLAEGLYAGASSRGRGPKGTHALILELAELSGTAWP